MKESNPMPAAQIVVITSDSIAEEIVNYIY